MGKELLEGLVQMASSMQSHKIVGGDELKSLIQSMVRIPGLAPGDKVRWKQNGMRYAKIPAIDDVVEVFSVYEKPIDDAERSKPVFHPDFTILSKDDDGDYVEFALDSRRFELVEKAS